MPRYTPPPVIEDPEAYARGRERNIKLNAIRGRQKKFDAAYPGLRERILNADARILPVWVRDAIFQWGGLTEKQAAFATRALDEAVDRAWDAAIAEEQRRASTPPWTPGRQTVTGKIVSIKWVESVVGWREVSTLKGLLVLADGRKLWLTIPSAHCPEGGVKDTTMTVKVTVELKRGSSDLTFAFGRRPTLVKETK